MRTENIILKKFVEINLIESKKTRDTNLSYIQYFKRKFKIVRRKANTFRKKNYDKATENALAAS